MLWQWQGRFSYWLDITTTGTRSGFSGSGGCAPTLLGYRTPLWQELLLLRELRADRWAAQQVDPLLLAESLLVVVSTMPVQIEALLAEPELMREPSLWSWTWLLLAFLPLAAVPFHSCSHLSATH